MNHKDVEDVVLVVAKVAPDIRMLTERCADRSCTVCADIRRAACDAENVATAIRKERRRVKDAKKVGEPMLGIPSVMKVPPSGDGMSWITASLEKSDKSGFYAITEDGERRYLRLCDEGYTWRRAKAKEKKRDAR